MLHIALFISTLTHGMAPADQPEPPERIVRVPEEQGAEDLQAFARAWSSAEEWRARGNVIREHILGTLELDLARPRPVPLPIIHSRSQHDGYTVDNVAIETAPGWYVTGNLYRPSGRTGPFAAVLCPHGHFQPNEDTPGGRFRADMQLRCATLARMGAVVLAYDMVGWGESTVIDHNHSDSLVLQTWNSVRIVDYLAACDDVDSARIAITGASGGGSQSFLLAAIDERISASVPVVMVSAHFFGGCLCESGLPIHRFDSWQTNNVEIAALAAPRAQLVVSCGDDWTKHTPDVEFPYLARVYEVLGAADRVANVHFSSEGHDYGASKRAAMYRFLAKHLMLDLAAVTNLDGSIDESLIEILSRQELAVFDENQSRPANELTDRAVIMEAVRSVTGSGE